MCYLATLGPLGSCQHMKPISWCNCMVPRHVMYYIFMFLEIDLAHYTLLHDSCPNYNYEHSHMQLRCFTRYHHKIILLGTLLLGCCLCIS
jgi:hypothetical protein